MLILEPSESESESQSDSVFVPLISIYVDLTVKFYNTPNI